MTDRYKKIKTLIFFEIMKMKQYYEAYDLRNLFVLKQN